MTAFLDDIHGRYATEKKAILSLCMGGAGFSVADLAHELGTSIPKVTRIVNELIHDGYLTDMGKQESATGRRPSLYGLNPGAGYFVGIDVCPNYFSLAVTDFPGRVIHFTDEIPYTLSGTEESVLGLCNTMLEHLADVGIEQSRIRAFGVNLTGRVNHATGYSYSYFISEEKPIRDVLENCLGKPVSVENDSRAMAYGEYMSGMSQEEGTYLFLNVGWGLGMGMILDGRLFSGKSGFSGEIGHFPLLDNNQFCRCGKIGCLETGASGSALHRLMLEKLREGRTSLLSDEYKAGNELTLEDILDAIQKEDVAAIECIEEIGGTLGRAVAGLINLFNPNMVIIGGRLSVTEHYLMPPLRSAVNKYSLNLVNNDTVIRVSRLGKEAGAIGASLLSKARLLDSMA